MNHMKSWITSTRKVERIKLRGRPYGVKAIFQTWLTSSLAVNTKKENWVLQTPKTRQMEKSMKKWSWRYTFTAVQLWKDFKKFVAECNQVALTITTATGSQCFTDETIRNSLVNFTDQDSGFLPTRTGNSAIHSWWYHSTAIQFCRWVISKFSWRNFCTSKESRQKMKEWGCLKWHQFFI